MASIRRRLRHLLSAVLNDGHLTGRASQRAGASSIAKSIHGEGNIFEAPRALLSDVVLEIEGVRNRVEIGAGAVLNNVRFFIRGDFHQIAIGRGCRFNRGGEVWIEDRECELAVGEGTTFESVHLALTEPGSRIEIGRDCMFATEIEVRTGDSHAIFRADTGERINAAKDVHIEDHVWVGARAILLKGTLIARDSVVGAGAVVSGHFPTPGAILAGNPAVKLREGITWSRERVDRLPRPKESSSGGHSSPAEEGEDT